MRPDTTPPGGCTPSESAIDVMIRPVHAPEFVAIVTLRGEHDMATAPAVEGALSPLKGDLLIDVTQCEFVDSSLISVLVGAHQSLQREGHRLELLASQGTPVARALDVCGVSRVIPVRSSLARGELSSAAAMLPATSAPNATTSPLTTVEVVRPASGAAFAAVVVLPGDHDLATAEDVQRALSSIAGNILVDLSECSFVDSSIMGLLISTSQQLERDGHYLEILAPRENELVTRTLDVVGMRNLVVVHPVRPKIISSEDS